jgi:DNA helicase HerA-like ATPase
MTNADGSAIDPDLARAQADAAAAASVAQQAQADATAALERARAAAEAAQAALEEATLRATAASEVLPPAESEPAPAITAPAAPIASGPLSQTAVDAVRAGYDFEGEALQMGALVNGEALADVQVRIPLGMVARHGLVAGATGTGKTKTLQGLAEQLSAAGVPVFAADIKGDLSGIATAGTPSDKLTARTEGIGQSWKPTAFPTEYFTLGGLGTGVPIRATITSFGPLLLSKVLGLNETQESSLGLVFHYADAQGLPLIDLADLRSVLSYLQSDEGKGELKDLGGLAPATIGVILRELITFADQGADVFFGEPEIDTADFLRLAPDGRGIVSLLEVPGVQDKPALFSTFLMWLLADLMNDLPEVGDVDKPKLVFFFDEAHLLFNDASKDFLAAITQTVRLIRSKGVGIFFVTQTPKDVPGDVLAQLGSRVQHQLRAHTPDDAKALRQTVQTYPVSEYDLGEVLQSLAIGEAVVTVMNEKGAPTPVAWTRMRAPQGSMDPTPTGAMQATVQASALLARYGTAVDPDSAKEMLARRLDAASAAAVQAKAAADAAAQAAKDAQTRANQAEKDEKARLARQKQIDAEYDRMVRRSEPPRRTTRTSRRSSKTPMEQVLGSPVTRTILTQVVRGIFGNARRR